MPNPNKNIPVLIANDQPLVRAGIATVLGSRSHMQVVGEAKNTAEVLDQLAKNRPRVLIIDIRLERISTFETIKKIRQEFPSVQVVVFSGSDGSEDIHRAIRAGARGYVSKDISDTELIEAIETVNSGGRHISEQIAVRLSDRLDKSTLTRREMEVLHWITKGKTNKEIADRLNMAEETVKHHVDNILSKLGVENRTSAATAALLRGIIHPQDL